MDLLSQLHLANHDVFYLLLEYLDTVELSRLSRQNRLLFQTIWRPQAKDYWLALFHRKVGTRVPSNRADIFIALKKVNDIRYNIAHGYERAVINYANNRPEKYFICDQAFDVAVRCGYTEVISEILIHYTPSLEQFRDWCDSATLFNDVILRYLIKRPQFTSTILEYIILRLMFRSREDLINLILDETSIVPSDETILGWICIAEGIQFPYFRRRYPHITNAMYEQHRANLQM